MRWICLGIALWLLATPAAAQSRAFGARCKESCARHLSDPRQRTVLCGRCLTDNTNDRGAWAAALKDESPRQDVLEEILKDDDWQVRWGAIRAMATRGFSDMRELSRWIMEGRDNLPCLTAIHLAGSKKQTTGAMLQVAGSMGPSSAALCWNKRDELRKALEVEMYSTDPLTRREALLHLSTFLEIAPARAVLNAMATRAVETDGAAAQLLVEDAAAGGPAAGFAVLKAAKEPDAARVNRLLAVWAVTFDAQRPKLKATEPLNDRKEAISILSAIGPLGAVELEKLLDDPDVSIRHGAARALARGEGMVLGLYAKQKLDPAAKLPNAVRIKWVEFLGRSDAESCAQTLKAAIADVRLDDGVRAAALSALGGCAGAAAMPEVKKALASKSPRQRAAAVAALGQIPRVAEAAQLVADALRDLEPEVLAAAIGAAAAQRLTTKIPEVVGLMEHGSMEVRMAAARALVVMGDSRSVSVLGRALQKDAAPEVREVCARGLGELGGPDAPGPLTHAAEKDVSSRVKYVASESLRKLGFSRAAK
jgi:HEAT repeat protein